MPGPAFCRGETVGLHPWEPEEDEAFFAEHRNRREVRRPLTDVAVRNRTQVEEHFEERLYDDGGLAFLVCTGDEDAMRTGDPEGLTRVGEVAIPWVNQPHGSGMLMYWAAPEHQGEGHITEATALLLDHAFGSRRINKVWAMVIEPNLASKAVLEKLGFEHEGTYRKETFYDGEFVDSHRYGLLAEDWLGQA